MSESLSLKWGTLKSWDIESEAATAAFNKWAKGGVSFSAMLQRNSDEQKQALCELIDAIDGPITNDWSGETLSKEDAKKYVLEYGN